MQFLRNLHEKQAKLFEKGTKLERLFQYLYLIVMFLLSGGEQYQMIHPVLVQLVMSIELASTK